MHGRDVVAVAGAFRLLFADTERKQGALSVPAPQAFPLSTLHLHLNPEPTPYTYTHHPAPTPYTLLLHSSPYTYTLHHTPYILHLHPSPYTYTLHPTSAHYTQHPPHKDVICIFVPGVLRRRHAPPFRPHIKKGLALWRR